MKRYDPQSAPDPEGWLSLDEDEKLAMVKKFVYAKEKNVGGKSEHAAIHVIVENQVAEGDDIPVAAAVARIQDEGLDRHEAIHSIGFLLMERMYGIKANSTPFDKEEYFEAVRNWSNQAWLDATKEEDDGFDADFDQIHYDPGPPQRRESPKIGRNKPCPCGSGSKFKKCCGKT